MDTPILRRDVNRHEQAKKGRLEKNEKSLFGYLTIDKKLSILLSVFRPNRALRVLAPEGAACMGFSPPFFHVSRAFRGEMLFGKMEVSPLPQGSIT